MLRRSSNAERSLGKRSAFFSSRMAKTLGVEYSSSKSQYISAKNSKKPCKALGSKSAKKPAECPLSDNDDIDVDLVQSDVL